MTPHPRQFMRDINPLEAANLDIYSSATTLTAIELEIYPVLVQAQIFANLLSPSLWNWKGNVPKRSGSPTRRKVEGIKQYIIHNYNFTHVSDRPGLDFYGTTTINGEENRFEKSQRTERIFNNLRDLFVECKGTDLSELLEVPDLRSHYQLSDYPLETIPVWGNETIDKMDAYREISPDRKGSGKCEALAALYASALIAVGDFPIEHVFVLFTPTHVMTYLMEGKGYLSSNKRMFSSISLRNHSDHTRVIRHCLEKGEVTRIQNWSGLINSFEAEVSIQKILLNDCYEGLHEYANEAKCSSPVLPDFLDKQFVPPLEVPQNLKDAGDWYDYISAMSERVPGSAYDLARYAFRDIDVSYLEAYAVVAKQRSPLSRNLMKKLKNRERAIGYVRNRKAQRKSLFGDGRLALPDETLLFGINHHRDSALLLYSLLSHNSEEPYVIFCDKNSYVWHQDELIPLSSFDPAERVRSMFNSYSHGPLPDSGLTVGDLLH
jgi:hypothetical protein